MMTPAQIVDRARRGASAAELHAAARFDLASAYIERAVNLGVSRRAAITAAIGKYRLDEDQRD